VFPARYELNSYIVFRKRLVSKRLNMAVVTAHKLNILSRSLQIEYVRVLAWLCVPPSISISNITYCHVFLTRHEGLTKGIQLSLITSNYTEL
jgi:hypothetical protein